MRRFAFLLAVMASFICVQFPAHANIGSTAVPRLAVSGGFTAPVGFQIFCLSHPGHCRGGGASEVRLTEALMSTLGAVNVRVNRAIRPRDESTDVWSIGVTSGDCEDYVLAKRAMLIGMGVPASALRIAIANTRQGIGHAVLIVRTDRGDLVLDNMTSQILPSDGTSLRWVAMTGDNGRSFHRIVS